MHRFVVYHAGKAFAVVHARNANEAIASALKKTTRRYRAENCVAVVLEVRKR